MPHPTTTAVKAGIDTDTQYGAVTPPLYLSSNYTFAGFDQPRQYDYTRSGNPTRDLLGQAISDLEGGAGGVITSTGMSAVTLVLQLLSPGDVVVAPCDCYGGTYRLLKNWSDRGLFEVQFTDYSDEQALGAAIANQPKLIWIETPSNPLLRIVDIQAICKQAQAVNALTAVDNTFLSPVLQQPIALGADIVIHSTTKYLNGHSDVVGGAVISATQQLHEKLAWWANCIGITGAPFDSLLTLRGIRTLDVRIKQHEENALAIVNVLDNHAAIAKVYHPSLPSHPGHEIACKQQTGFGSIISFELAGDVEQVKAFLGQLKQFTLAESLGGVESLICHPATMTHAAMDQAAQQTAGIKPSLLRLSVGIEHIDDLLNDLQTALQAIANPALEEVN